MSSKILSNMSFFLIAMCFSFTSYADIAWIDVRSAAEHKIDKIEGDLRISHLEIVQEVIKIFPEKNTEIHLYCRIGGRAGIAMSALTEAGYTNVFNAGSIYDARMERDLSEYLK